MTISTRQNILFRNTLPTNEPDAVPPIVKALRSTLVSAQKTANTYGVIRADIAWNTDAQPAELHRRIVYGMPTDPDMPKEFSETILQQIGFYHTTDGWLYIERPMPRLIHVSVTSDTHTLSQALQEWDGDAKVKLCQDIADLLKKTTAVEGSPLKIVCSCTPLTSDNDEKTWKATLPFRKNAPAYTADRIVRLCGFYLDRQGDITLSAWKEPSEMYRM